MSLRIRILKSILKSPLTADEIASASGDTRQRVISNIGPIASDGLVKRISGISGTVEYQITEAGKVYYHRNATIAAPGKANKTPPNEVAIESPANASAEPMVEVIEAPQPVDTIDPSATDKESLIAVEPIEFDGNDSEWVPLDEQPESARPIIQAAAEEPSAAAEDRDLYVVFGASMPVPEIAGPTLENAQQQCISLAFDSGTDLTLYRLVPVGQTRTSVSFVAREK